ncbi:hypothetical protein [Polymorphobacter megasporae]|uniref:hypothetical protein n=1 Tax=Glacieibacterium megasporae TaxID=2835787 RepID=UPI001C1E38AF|nr:hypothetical protein [Polymorphobacter megasporae]UAJ10566.1 hypothetical protein KTC28_02050 [Polymorphobacter megasporae]
MVPSAGDDPAADPNGIIATIPRRRLPGISTDQDELGFSESHILTELLVFRTSSVNGADQRAPDP